MMTVFWIAQGESTFEVRATTAVEGMRHALDNLPDEARERIEELARQGLPVQFTAMAVTPSMKMPKGTRHAVL